MYDDKPKHDDHDRSEDLYPAAQPHDPGTTDDCSQPPPDPDPPGWKDPPLCVPNPRCECPEVPSSDPNCLESLITDKAGELAEAEKTKAFKADLEALLTKANAAGQEYTQAKYEQLVKEWVRQDALIARQIRDFVCGLPCWKCAIECYICPLLHKMNQAQQKLYWDPKSYPYPTARNLYDLLYWYTRDKEEKERTFNRIKSVLAVWEKPAQTIEKALADNAKLYADIDKAPSTDAAKILYDLFLRLVPRHLAIAPPAGSQWKTKIDKKFVDLCYCEDRGTNDGDNETDDRCQDGGEKPKPCKCDKGQPDDCCGPDVGYWSLRQRLIGPQPYLIDPGAYITVICCLVKTRYQPAQEGLSKAETNVLLYETLIKQAKDAIENGLKDFEKNAKARLPNTIECCGKKLCKAQDQQNQTAS